MRICDAWCRLPIFVWGACNGNCARVKCSWSPRVYDVMPGHDLRMGNAGLWLVTHDPHWPLIGPHVTWEDGPVGTEHHDPDTGTKGRVGGERIQAAPAKEVSTIGIFLSHTNLLILCWLTLMIMTRELHVSYKMLTSSFKRIMGRCWMLIKYI